MSLRCLGCRLEFSDAALPVHDVAVTVAPPEVACTGLLAWSTALVGPFYYDGLAVRRKADGRLAVSWPQRKAANGARYAIATIVDDDLRCAVERDVIAAFEAAAPDWRTA